LISRNIAKDQTLETPKEETIKMELLEERKKIEKEYKKKQKIAKGIERKIPSLKILLTT
jgi:hypothetical protein